VFHAVGLLNGTIDSMFRSPEVNAQVPGSVKNSYHQHGLAVDIAPGFPWNPATGFRLIAQHALSADLGPVRTVIWEPSWVHIDWFQPHEPRRPLKLFRKVGDDYQEVTL
jgi:hypothetical protein